MDLDRRELLKYGAIALGSFGLGSVPGPTSVRLHSTSVVPDAAPIDLGKGCDPTGHHVCTAQLNAGLARAAGRVAWLGAGTYLFDRPLLVPPRTVLDGPGTLKLAGRADLPGKTGALMLGSECTVRGITLDGNKDHQISDAPMILGVDVATLQIVGVSIRDAPGRSIYLYRCRASQVTGCQIEGGGLTEANDGTRAAIITFRSSQISISNNRISNIAGEGIVLACDEAFVVDNDIENTHSIAVAVGGGHRRDILISGNHIRIAHTWKSSSGLIWPGCIDVGNSIRCMVVGNHLEGGGGGVGNAPPSYQTIVASNTCEGAATSGIWLGGSGASNAVDLLISDNTCVGNGGPGIALPYVAQAVVRDNVCLDNGQSTGIPHRTGILVYGGGGGGYVNKLVIERNRCGNQQEAGPQLSGIQIQGTRNANVYVLDNDLRGNGRWAIHDDSKPGALLSGNVG